MLKWLKSPYSSLLTEAQKDELYDNYLEYGEEYLPLQLPLATSLS